jgi:predicted alpha/beta hydrolase
LVKFEKKSFVLFTEDNVSLSAILLQPDNPKGVIQINSATAVPKEFYLGIASYFAENNYACLVFDYRGICGSQPKKGLKNCNYEIMDWPKKDMKAVFEYLNKTFPMQPVFLLCHSVGGQLAALMPDLSQIKGMITVSTSSGYAVDMTFIGRFRSFYFFEIIRPLVHLIYGFTKVKPFRIMEDMPKNVTNIWRKWCSKPDYFFHKKYAKEIEGIEIFERIPFAISVFTATDDSICTPANVESFWKGIRSTKGIDFIWLKPSKFKLESIGHFDFFRKKNKEKLWILALKRMDEYYSKTL